MAVISNIHPLWDALPISVGKEEREYSERTALPVFEQIFQEAIDNVRPVSYTHLDVYKRQGQSRL